MPCVNFVASHSAIFTFMQLRKRFFALHLFWAIALVGCGTTSPDFLRPVAGKSVVTGWYDPLKGHDNVTVQSIDGKPISKEFKDQLGDAYRVEIEPGPHTIGVGCVQGGAMITYYNVTEHELVLEPDLVYVFSSSGRCSVGYRVESGSKPTKE